MSTFRLLCLIFLGTAFFMSAQGQDPVTIKKIKFYFDNPPQYVVSGGTTIQQGVSSTDKWLITEVSFDTTPTWINDATFEVFVLVKSGNGFQNLKGTAVYQDIAAGINHKIAMFMTPQTFKRYTGSSTQQAIQDVAVKVTVGGAVVDIYSERNRRRTSRRWWEETAPQEAILRTLHDTPWYPIYSGYYEQLKPK